MNSEAEASPAAHAPETPAAELKQSTAPAPPTKTPTPPAPGEVITSELTGNSYTMRHPIGEGSFGVVYECEDGWNNRLAAKVLKPTKSYEEVKASAQAELQKLFQLRHPFVTYVFDAFEFRDTFYIITERCDFSLDQLFGQEWFRGEVWLMPIARCILQAVHFIHTAGFVHQDIHVGNVLAATVRDEMGPARSGSTVFKLGDLGVAKLFNQLDAANTRAQWMLPPEAIDSSEFGPLDHRIDIFHCGLLLLQLAQSRTLQFTAEEIKAGKPRHMALQLQPPLYTALEKALRRHVQMRTATALELWRDLNSPPPAIPAAPIEPSLDSSNSQMAPAPHGAAPLSLPAPPIKPGEDPPSKQPGNTASPDSNPSRA